MLVSDSLVCSEKIGISNYFWSFPSSAYLVRKRKRDSLQKELESLQQLNSDLDERIAQAKIGREEGDERDNALAALREAENENKSLLEEYAAFKDQDPEILKKKGLL
jgi:hypothetical protein